MKHLMAVLFAATLLFGDAPAAFAQAVSFNRDIFPILSDRCFVCHGPNSKDRKAKLRLDQADGVEGAYRTRKDSTAIKPGSLKDSALWYRITTTDVDERMPPAEAHKNPLSKEEQAIIKSWIEAGAPAAENVVELPARTKIRAEDRTFWAFRRPHKQELPDVQAIDRGGMQRREWALTHAGMAGGING